MPMDFPNMDSLKRAAEVHKFRQPNEGETEQQYRTALADYVRPIDFIESQEIRTSKGWDQWNDAESLDMLKRVPRLAEVLDINVWYRQHANCPTCGVELRKLPPESNLIPHWEGRCNG